MANHSASITETRRAIDPDVPPTAGFKAIMREAAETRSYAAAYQTTSCTPSGLYCTTTRTFAAVSISSAESWTGSAQHVRTCAATSFVGPPFSNFPFSTPPTPIGSDAVLVCPQLGGPARVV
jgi:hypothetical protein